MHLRRKHKRLILKIAILVVLAIILTRGEIIQEWRHQALEVLSEYGIEFPDTAHAGNEPQSQYHPDYNFKYSDIPEYSDTPYYTVNGNVPFFTDEEMTTESYEYYSDLDPLGRCGTTVACIGIDIMPTEKRGDIGNVKPTGWQSPQVRYDFIDGTYLYNRCHLIGFQLAGENDNPKNLITGTRYMNVDGMLPFENEATWYVKNTENHLMYRVTPIFIDDELVARGVLMEARSVEDNGEGVQYCVFVYNVQPNITIDYKTGEAWATDGTPQLGRN